MHPRLDCFYQMLFVAVMVATLCSCGKSSPDVLQHWPETRATSDAAIEFRSSPIKHAGQNQIDTPSSLEAAREDPDPRVRLHAIETWAAKPGKTLDPVTYALVDPDETVRARAQELFEEALERK
jgi:hypothetical protein